ncbi:sugar ABC transporter ATP-binding protein [bacterium LRH843]|nr:sugar ABC transporter ATP-binding protein [bacterium LRH843]
MLLKVENIYKSYGSKEVLTNNNLEVKKGEIHALVGKNGAGKTTLVKIISGVIDDYEGNIIFNNKNINKLSVIERQNEGIYVVPQHAAVIPEFSIAENIVLGTWPKDKAGLVNWKRIHESAEKALTEYGLEFDLNMKVKDLSLVDQRKLNVVRALFSKAKLVILDEPTTALSAEERDSLFEFIKKQSEQGTSFILISHYLEEILKLCDTITVNRDGQSYTGYKKGEVDEATLSALIVGESVELLERSDDEKTKKKEVALECKSIVGSGMKNVSFQVGHGEILGLVGFPGSGAREICRALSGLNPITEGQIYLNGKELVIPKNPSRAVEQKVIYVSFDRHKEGVVQLLSIKENISLSILNSSLKKMFGFINQSEEDKNAGNYFDKLNIRASSVDEEVGNLSGGNQQKVVLSKALSCQPEVLILDEPTVGIDVKSREEILSLIDDLTKKSGLTVLYYTNDFNELLRISDRLLFFEGGSLMNDKLNIGLTSEEVMRIRDIAKEGVVS